MSIGVFLQDPNSSEFTELTADGRVRVGAVDLPTNAEEGSVAIGTIEIDDPDGDLFVGAHRLIIVYEDEADNEYGLNNRLFTGYTANRRLVRGRSSHRTGAARTWQVDVSDGNTILSRRVMVGADAQRPAETDIERLQWLIETNEASHITDFRYFNTDGAVQMDEADYSGQMLFQVLDDCAQQSGKNWFVTFFQDVLAYSLWYDWGNSTEWSSDLRLSNVEADCDYNETWLIADQPEAALTLKADRVYSGAYVTYDGGYVYKQRQATADEFVRRDAIMPAENVKTATQANARATRYLNDISTEEHRVTLSYWVSAAKVNHLLPGQRVQVRSSHWGVETADYTDWTWMRCLSRQVKHVANDPNWTAGTSGGGGVYLVSVELAPPEPEHAAAGSVYGILWQPHNGWLADYNHIVWYGDGDAADHPPGYPDRPTVGLIAPTINGSLPDTRDHVGWTINGTGTVNVNFTASWVGVAFGSHTVIWEIRKNGATVGSTTKAISVVGNTGYTDIATVSITGLAVAPGDELTAHVSASPGPYFFTVPAGVGVFEEQFEISGGSLA